MKLNKKTLAVSAATIVIVGGVSAFAYVTAGGGGSGTGNTAEIVDLEIAGTVTDLGPGLTKPVAGTFNNTNEFPVKATSIDIAVDLTGDAGSHCVAADFTTTSATAGSGAMIDFPVSTGTWSSDTVSDPDLDVTGGTVTMNNTEEDQTDCMDYLKDNDLPLTFTVTP